MRGCSSLSSTTVYTIATAQSQIRIDSSALNRLSITTPSSKQKITIPEFLTLEETRAFLTVLLNKLLRCNSSEHVQWILESLNCDRKSFDFGDKFDVTEDNKHSLLMNSAVLGVSSVLDYQLTGLLGFADVAAAFSCEALKADVTDLYLKDCRSKEEDGVAAYMKKLLNNSKLVVKNMREASKADATVLNIVTAHGMMRDNAKLLHTRIQVDLNSDHNLGKAELLSEPVCCELFSLATALRLLGQCSFTRTRRNLLSIGSSNLKGLGEIFQKECPTDASLVSNFNESLKLYSDRVYDKFAHEINVLFSLVWKIVAWELVSAYAVIEAAELNEMIGNILENGENSKVDKNEKAGLGEGTSKILARIKERLQSEKKSDVDNSRLLETWVADFLSFLDFAKPGFNDFLLKVKDDVESRSQLLKIPKGTLVHAKGDMTIREKAFSTIKEVFERHGATALDTPLFEMRETLLGKYGEESKLIYDLADQDGELCSLRYDLTVPFARYVAKENLTSFRRYQIGKVYRRDNTGKGRYREFYQYDFDIAGGPAEPMASDFEVVRILTELLDELKLEDFEIKLNHRKLLDGILQICGVPPEKFRTICSSIDKLDKKSFEHIRKEMVEEKGLTAETADQIGTYVKEKGHPFTILSKLKQERSDLLKNAGSVDAFNDLEFLFKALDKSKRLDKVVFDLSLARGLDYYTGVIFEAVLKGDAAEVGSIAAGGRYDNLIGMLGSKKEVPVVGLSLGMERVFTILKEREYKNQVRATKTEVLVSILVNDTMLGLELCGELWDAGVKAEYLVNKRRDKHFAKAKEEGIPWIILVGEQEIKGGTVQLRRTMKTGGGNDVPINIARLNFVKEFQKWFKTDNI